MSTGDDYADGYAKALKECLAIGDRLEREDAEVAHVDSMWESYARRGYINALNEYREAIRAPATGEEKADG